jgi:hypothetical protein
MDEYSMPEQPLSEELLQQVTGGCKDCNSDKLAIKDYQTGVYRHSWLADLARSNGQYDQYDFHSDKAFLYAVEKMTAQERIAQREATPGHVILPEPQRPPARRWIM